MILGYRFWFISFLAFLFSTAFAQTGDFGIWTSIGAKKEIGKWDMGVNTEVRTFNNSSQFQRWSIELDAEYKLMKQIKAGMVYIYFYFNDVEYADYQPRVRYAGFVQGKLTVGDFHFYLREKVQRTIKDESDRIKESGKYDNYRINPEWTLRSRVKIDYNIPHFPGTPSFSIEPFYQLNNPDGNTFNNIRYTLSFDYKISKQHEIKAYGLTDNELNVDDAVRMYVLGLGYTFSF
ncbi:MAG: DUF2490 domain-containing protein [Bacteroidales bacterium]|nr:DUF2490 domain-containing protein [Bacteroidales bacterium]